MEKIGGTVKPALIILLLVILTSGGCKKYSTCEDLPNDVTQLQGEWEWVYTKRQFIIGNGSLYNDTITQGQIGAVVTLNITDDGCLKYKVNAEEYYACLDVWKNRIEEDTFPAYQCNEMVWMNIDAKDFATNAFAQVEGTDCSTMNALEGLMIPFSVQRSYLQPPPEPPGLELSSYKNHFVRK